jgi:hypothetical protein
MTHVPLSALLQRPLGAAAAAGAALQQLAGPAAVRSRQSLVAAAAAAQPAVATEVLGGSANRVDIASSMTDSRAAAAVVVPAADVSAAAAAAGLQVFRLEELERHAQAAEAALAAGQQLQPQHMAVVPDASRPFTLTMTSGHDGVEYVVAHYEPAALQHSSSKLAALLCEVRAKQLHPQLLKQGVSAAGLKS